MANKNCCIIQYRYNGELRSTRMKNLSYELTSDLVNFFHKHYRQKNRGNIKIICVFKIRIKDAEEQYRKHMLSNKPFGIEIKPARIIRPRPDWLNLSKE